MVLVIASGVLMIAIAVAIGVIVFRARRQDREWEVEVARRTEAVQRAERLSLATQLQDNIYPRIYGIRMEVGDSDPELVSRLDHIAASLRNLTSDNREFKVPGGDFRAALSALASPTPGGAVELDLEDGMTVEGEAAFHLYRVAQEAIHNARKHARAGTIRVELVSERGMTVLRIEDDGPTSFGTEGNMREGFGLRSMRSRIRSLGGTIHIGPGRDGRCTIIEAALPEA